VLFARLRPYLNKVHRAERAGVCSTEFHVMRIRDRSRVLPDYLATMLRCSLIVAQTCHMMTGNTHPRLANQDVVNLIIPIPSKEVQQLIAAEVHRRRAEARRLRAEAKADWAEAKGQFEEQLLSQDS
jgi:restriction endonuclease S subunit